MGVEGGQLPVKIDDIYIYIYTVYVFIIPSKEMKVFDWLIRIQHLKCYCLANLSKHNIGCFEPKILR